MRILWFTWKDPRHPTAGGAEVVSGELARRLAADGHEVEMITSGFSGAPSEEVTDGYRIIRRGSRFSVYWQAYVYWRRERRGWADVVIDEMNTLPFFAALYARGARRFLFVHQLCREIWFYQLAFPLSLVGYLLEPLWLRLLSGREVIAVSESTRRDLMRYGFRRERIHVISEGIQMSPLLDLAEAEKSGPPVVLSFGSIRPMKRTHHVVRAFELAKRRLPELKLVVAGRPEGAYGRRVVDLIKRSPFAADIQYLGPVSREEKKNLLRSAHVVALASVKEGWGLTVTEAASQGTPAVVYDVDGLRDSVRDGETGITCRKNTPAGMADAIVELLSKPERYAARRQAALAWSREINFDRSYGVFSDIVCRPLQAL